MNRTRLLLLSSMLVTSSITPAIAAEDIMQALREGKPLLDIRMRYEQVDQDGFSKDAYAPTIRARFGYETGKFHDVSALLELERIQHIGAERYNDTVNGNTLYPAVNDPEDTAVNRLQLQYTGLPETVVTAGRQSAAFDNQRFIGYSKWRQNDTTFDGFALHNASIPKVEFDYAHFWHVHRVLGNDSPVGEYRGPVDLAHITYHAMPWLDVSPYAYLMDFGGHGRTVSSQTYGLRATGSHALDESWKLLYAAEFARQKDYGNNPNSYSESYFLAEPGIGYRNLAFKIGYESLGGNGVAAMQTPLATLHAVNGWADKFTTIPPNGLEDRYLEVSYSPTFHDWVKDSKLVVQLHDYDAERTDDNYGREWGVNLEKKLTKQWMIGTKYASYHADDFSTDTNKFWVYVQYTY